ncbi:MAG TPA: HXXEE domain-containing protein [Opitutaceae bacterium]|nr:HXXEE domain-containing protein [Opitutaceae bacterium]
MGTQTGRAGAAPSWAPWIRILWLFPLGLAVHDFEEWATLPGWFAAQRDMLEQVAVQHPAAGRALHALAGSAAQQAGAIGLVVLLSFVVTAGAARSGRRGVWLAAYVVALGAALLHVPVHLLQAVYFRTYIPGLFGAVLVLLPAGTLVVRRLLAERLVAPGELALAAVAGLAVFGPLVIAAHALACRLVA